MFPAFRRLHAAGCASRSTAWGSAGAVKPVIEHWGGNFAGDTRSLNIVFERPRGPARWIEPYLEERGIARSFRISHYFPALRYEIAAVAIFAHL